MDFSILVLASASVPFGLIALHDIASGEARKGMFGAASAAWSVSGVLLVYLGVPGLLFFPGLLLIMIAASLSRLRRGGGVLQFAKPSALAAVLALVTIGMVML